MTPKPVINRACFVQSFHTSPRLIRETLKSARFLHRVVLPRSSAHSHIGVCAGSLFIRASVARQRCCSRVQCHDLSSTAHVQCWCVSTWTSVRTSTEAGSDCASVFWRIVPVALLRSTLGTRGFDVRTVVDHVFGVTDAANESVRAWMLVLDGGRGCHQFSSLHLVSSIRRLASRR